MFESDSDTDTLPGSKYDKYGQESSGSDSEYSSEYESTDYDSDAYTESGTETESEAESESQYSDSTRATIEAILRSILAKGNGPEYDALMSALASQSPGQNDCGIKG